MGQHAEAFTANSSNNNNNNNNNNKKWLNYYMNTEISEESEQNHQGPKTAINTTKQTEREKKIGDRNAWKEIKSHRCKHQQ